MTRLASFGPVLSLQPTPTLPVSLKHILNLNVTRVVRWYIKNAKKKKTHTYGPNDARHVVWAHFPHCRPFLH